MPTRKARNLKAAVAAKVKEISQPSTDAVEAIVEKALSVLQPVDQAKVITNVALKIETRHAEYIANLEDQLKQAREQHALLINRNDIQEDINNGEAEGEQSQSDNTGDTTISDLLG